MGLSKDPPEKKDEAVYLRKKITLLRAISLTIGTIIGSGIFISPKGVLKHSGSVGLSLIVWVACGILSMFGALSYADIGTTIKKSGGHYIYLLETLGPVPAFLRLWAEFVMIRPANIAVGCLAFGRYLIEPFFAPCHAPSVTVKLISVICITFIIALNCWSVSWSANVQMLFTVLKLVAVGLIIVPGIIALGNGHTENFQNMFDTTSLTLTELPLAFYSGMFAYSGWFYINFVTEEMINPERNIPITVIVSLILITICYLLANVSYYTILTADEILASEAVAVMMSSACGKAWVTSLNQNKISVQLTMFWGAKSIEFLDFTVHINSEFKLITKLYRKPTATYSFLNWHSHHPEPLKTGILYGQYLRAHRNSTNDDDFIMEANILKSFVLQKGYPKRLLKWAFNHAKNVDNYHLSTPVIGAKSNCEKNHKM
ncbi:cystine glutamate transporter-like [Pelobates cultripes]|uniref:Cystine glutamate transporter-like n=1 Tax=Pelobates cultripes TaxID=61616 RepID=A0AAD1RR33_PELCU|nr:cystine glutamate transporter-like [Pelobates cultripes]